MRAGIIDAAEVENATAIHMEKTNPTEIGAGIRFEAPRLPMGGIMTPVLIAVNGPCTMAVDFLAANLVGKVIWRRLNTATTLHEDVP